MEKKKENPHWISANNSRHRCASLSHNNVHKMEFGIKQQLDRFYPGFWSGLSNCT